MEEGEQGYRYEGREGRERGKGGGKKGSGKGEKIGTGEGTVEERGLGQDK